MMEKDLISGNSVSWRLGNYQIVISYRFAALENLSDDEDIQRAWENIKENIKTAAKENLVLHKLKPHKPWFDKECLDFLGRRKQAKMQCVQDPSQSNVDNEQCKT